MIIAGNWKMNLLRSESEHLAREIAVKAKKLQSTECWVAPVFTAIDVVTRSVNESVHVGAQNVHWETGGAYTGEVSAAMLRDVGCQFTLVGHSERRQYFGETNQGVRKRAQAALEAGLDAIVCIGETLQQREQGRTEEVLKEQLRQSISIEFEALQSRLVLAYEPVWAIGTGKVATNEEIAHAHAFLHEELRSMGFQKAVPILYGGSVKPSNFESIKSIEHVGGALVGGASLTAESFCELLKLADEPV